MRGGPDNQGSGAKCNQKPNIHCSPTRARAAPGRVCFWELVDEGLVAELAAHAGCVTSLAMHPAGACLLTASVDGCVKVWV
jgi:WD40 repeat protein